MYAIKWLLPWQGTIRYPVLFGGIRSLCRKILPCFVLIPSPFPYQRGLPLPIKIPNAGSFSSEVDRQGQSVRATETSTRPSDGPAQNFIVAVTDRDTTNSDSRVVLSLVASGTEMSMADTVKTVLGLGDETVNYEAGERTKMRTVWR